jgi:hypothetical protein
MNCDWLKEEQDIMTKITQNCDEDTNWVPFTGAGEE